MESEKLNVWSLELSLGEESRRAIRYTYGRRKNEYGREGKKREILQFEFACINLYFIDMEGNEVNISFLPYTLRYVTLHYIVLQKLETRDAYELLGFRSVFSSVQLSLEFRLGLHFSAVHLSSTLNVEC